MTPSSSLRRFFLPTLNKRYFIRLVLVVLASYLVFGYLLIPLRIQGVSMEPTYRDRTYAFSWRLQYAFAPMERFDVVTVRYSGRRLSFGKGFSISMESSSTSPMSGIVPPGNFRQERSRRDMSMSSVIIVAPPWTAINLAKPP